MEHERKVSLPGLQLGFSSDGAVAAAALPSSMRTAASLPEATLMDGTAQALRLGRLAGSRTRCVLMSRGLPMFGAGGLSDAGLSALRHEMLRRLELPADALAFLLQGTRRELVPVGPLADRCVQAWRRLSAGALLPDGWTGLEESRGACERGSGADGKPRGVPVDGRIREPGAPSGDRRQGGATAFFLAQGCGRALGGGCGADFVSVGRKPDFVHDGSWG